jgi:hypothetical protein
MRHRDDRAAPSSPKRASTRSDGKSHMRLHASGQALAASPISIRQSRFSKLRAIDYHYYDMLLFKIQTAFLDTDKRAKTWAFLVSCCSNSQIA